MSERVYYVEHGRTWWWTRVPGTRYLTSPCGIMWDPPPEGSIVLDKPPLLDDDRVTAVTPPNT